MLKSPSSQIRSPLPPLVEKALKKREIDEDDVVIVTSTDLDIVGAYSEGWLVVTKEQVLVYLMEEDEGEALLVRELPVDKIESVRTDSRVGSGFLEAKTSDEVYEEIVRFSNKNAEKFAKVAAMIRSLAEGKQVEVKPEEEEKLAMGRCQKCGIRLPDRHMTICPKCMKRGLVFLRFLGLTKGYWPYMGAMMALVVFTILLSFVPAQLTRVLLDNVFDDKGLPYVVEVAFAWRGDKSPEQRRLITGVNWSPGIGDPFRSFGTAKGDGLATLLESQRAGPREPVVFFVNLVSPCIRYLDRGKTSIVISNSINERNVA